MAAASSLATSGGTAETIVALDAVATWMTRLLFAPILFSMLVASIGMLRPAS